jgi:thiamine transporter ThiT
MPSAPGFALQGFPAFVVPVHAGFASGLLAGLLAGLLGLLVVLVVLVVLGLVAFDIVPFRCSGLLRWASTQCRCPCCSSTD